LDVEPSEDENDEFEEKMNMRKTTTSRFEQTGGLSSSRAKGNKPNEELMRKSSTMKRLKSANLHIQNSQQLNLASVAIESEGKKFDFLEVNFRSYS